MQKFNVNRLTFYNNYVLLENKCLDIENQHGHPVQLLEIIWTIIKPINCQVFK